MAFEQSENPELWAFLESLRPGAILSGVIAAIESFGVFVKLDQGPAHPNFAGVGFITIPELAWQPFASATDAVRVGQRVSCEFLQFDTWNLEARLSLRATQPDPFQSFADHVAEGQELTGQVTKVVPFGVFVRVADGVEGLVRHAHADVGDDMTVVVADIDRSRRKLELRAG